MAFERDPAGRQQSEVQRYQIMRPVDDPAHVLIELGFNTTSEAASFVATMREVWQSPQAAPALLGSPQVRIVEVVERHEYR